MVIPAFKRLLKTDYAQSFQQMIETLSYSLNNAIESLNNAMANGVSLKSNILCTIKVLNIQVDVNGKPTSSLVFPLTFTGQVLGVSVVNVVNQTNSSIYPTGAVMPFFVQTQTGVQINNITGLQPNNTYNVTVVAWGAGA